MPQLRLRPAGLRLAANVPTLFRRFSPHLRRVRWPAALSAALVLASPLVAGGLIWAVKLLIDDVFVAGRLDMLPVFAAIYALAVGGKVALDYALALVKAAVVERIIQDVRTGLYRHLVAVSPGSLGRHGPGDLLAHLSGDAERVEILLYTEPLGVFGDAAEALFFAGFLLLLSWKLTVCALLAVPFLVLVSWRQSPRIRRAARIARRQATSWVSLAEERLGAAPVIHAFNAQDEETARFAARCDAARRAELRTVALQARLTALIEITAALGGIAVLAAAAYEIHAGTLTLGALVAFLGSLGSLYGPVRGLANATGRLQRAAAAAQRVADLLDAPSLVAERPAARPLPRVRGAVEFRDVRFAYPDGPEVLRGVSFRVEPGETVAVVGPSGSGKSTLISLALRLRDPTDGAVLVDGQDLREITLESLREAVAPVFQEPCLFRGTIAENIRYGRPAADDERVRAAARDADADRFVGALRAGYAAPVGPHGTRLSGGQRQRLALARALLRDAPILLLDEATAAVDSEAEEAIQEALDRLAGRRTLLVVTHRLSSLRRADRVIVLDDGRIVEAGTPDALLRGRTRYRDLFAAQLALAGAPA